ncbi:DsbA oxidoreductase [Lysobacter enzymogenes]|uniref:DsbA oxidoreductase n=1 Tax=Lysobacter enzymogenes TaxID=69 RepID=A0A0S2DNC2_LYSEN|nr:DsbA family oxidoreductase [Lysobacter enzymogenes]ALN60036.1 DsbA oxidoreductase [Lysobacter enzymogenes]QCW28058.1 DsbA family oxidoreductase [Lysobacter enzymogenes]
MNSTAVSPTPKVKIDFVSDVVCPWCAVGLNSLEQAIARLDGEVEVELHFQPFELNPQMAPEGENIDEHLAHKYGLGAEQLASNREALRQRGAALGFAFGERDRIYNTFDAHRLLHWAGTQGADAERALKHALLKAYFTDGRDVSSREVLAAVADESGLDAQRARAVLDSDEYAQDVRQQERFYQEAGISAVPSVIINDRHLIQGGQPVEQFEAALRQIAAQGGGRG